MQLSLDEMIHRNEINSKLSNKCRTIMNKFESGNIYLGKYKENICIYQCEIIVEINQCMTNKFS